mmetsp:Transcript_64303/g.153349  ORF Transcript_64303/g.153349 Transcript_64303/m.153349 type:complete len:608 (-) Transcript_64303:81-1904(-)|eukprot:CAMPEP_0178392158 /NCGR_PEP_ID=MMETSP0689_2-20121128/11534_1 /TAXON_ID=160604 /ORGANISM="Amphidinium massartii, Strain CS-259" /LENGTH=607 /DNA_ID=CAMNT_0020012723 /DNA_START=144 /DNA_END=1967 /DNA_ORIENTATION=-
MVHIPAGEVGQMEELIPHVAHPESPGSSGENLVIKNTFYDSPTCNEDDVGTMRRAFSEPRQGETTRSNRLRSCAPHLLVGGSEEDDGNCCARTSEKGVEAYKQDDDESPVSPLYRWPSTPEGGSSPYYRHHQQAGDQQAGESRPLPCNPPTLLTSARAVACCGILVVPAVQQQEGQRLQPQQQQLQLQQQQSASPPSAAAATAVTLVSLHPHSQPPTSTSTAVAASLPATSAPSIAFQLTPPPTPLPQQQQPQQPQSQPQPQQQQQQQQVLHASMSYLGVPFQGAVETAAAAAVVASNSIQKPTNTETPLAQQLVQVGGEGIVKEPSSEDLPSKTAAIAQLQELLQTPQLSTSFRYPAGTQVLQWTYKQRNTNRCFFRAVVAFLRDGVGHHIAGGWESSKKTARQNAAEAALTLLKGPRSLLLDLHMEAFVDTGALIAAEDGTRIASGEDCIKWIAHYAETQCREIQEDQQRQHQKHEHPSSAAADTLVSANSNNNNILKPRGRAVTHVPTWSLERVQAHAWKAQVQVLVQGIRHTFSGPCCTTREEAKNELARRAVWYLSENVGLSPGGSSFKPYVPDCESLLASDCRVRAPPNEWLDALAADMIL